MPRGCGCAGSSCGCLMVPGAGVTITGTGNASDPFVITAKQADYIYQNVTTPGLTINLTGITESDAVVYLEIEVDIRLLLSTTAPIGTRVSIRTTQSFGAKVITSGNLWTQDGVLLGVPPDRYFPIPTGNGWLECVKVSDIDWFVAFNDMVY